MLSAYHKFTTYAGECVKLEGAPELAQWNRVNCMVTSWILKSISKEIVEAFLYTTTAKELWEVIKERFGESNGSLLYQIQREISTISQGTMSIVKYYTKLHKLWDELACLMPSPICTCGAARSVSEINGFNKLMQFLMGLNDTYDNIRNQILVMDPLPSINKAYSMVLRVEKQREVHGSYNDNIESNALLAKTKFYKKEGMESVKKEEGSGRGNSKRVDKANKHCSHYNMNGHVKETCFKLHGYPDWHKDLKGGKGSGRNVANMVDTPLDIEDDSEDKNSDKQSAIANLVQQELMKLLKGKMTAESGVHVNFAHLNDFAGLLGAKPTSTPFPKGQKLFADKGTPLAEPDKY
ncbi:PREDICTED: uncharacterized protein LOC104595553 isoform X2 [Nelumbo nucifera]|uniref:Uncharacterized protein LOC104595553 isoform X2 n=1 Tax=Nelumbo nucifera TaxID=4432 RepID=A0A1U8Q344_NELNU|nr:PREDICTED: uncharacterized protein LOC104595553 isoform X2 [Nelumbo nucifera]